MKTNSTIIGILGGVVAGAIIGVLLAPAKGSETRKKIAKKSNQYSDSVKESYQNLVGKTAKNGEELIEKEISNLSYINS